MCGLRLTQELGKHTRKAEKNKGDRECATLRVVCGEEDT